MPTTATGGAEVPGRSPADAARVRIGELGRRVGMPAPTLRMWERRYGILAPERTEAGYRLYSGADEARLRRMIELIGEGLAPAEAAQQALREADDRAGDAGGGDDPRAALTELRGGLLACIEAFDEPGTQRVLDRAAGLLDVDALVTELILPVLNEAGHAWKDDALCIGQEHFGSQILRARLLAMGRGWGAGDGPLLLLACPPGEEHDLPLAAFGLLMRERGCRIALLGADTPLETLAGSVAALDPACVVLSLTAPEAGARLAAAGPLALGARVTLAGAAASPELAAHVGAELLPGSMAEAAGSLAATV